MHAIICTNMQTDNATQPLTIIRHNRAMLALKQLLQPVQQHKPLALALPL